MKHLLFSIALILGVSVHAQSNFTINGISKFYDGKKLTVNAILINTVDAPYSTINLPNPEIHVFNEKFVITGSIDNYPQPIEISYYEEDKNRLYYATIFIDDKDAIYTLNVPDLGKGKDVHIDLDNGQSQLEYNSIVKQLRDKMIGVMPFNEDNFQKKSTFLQDYIKKHPNSFIAFWMIVSDYRYVGYKKSFADNLRLFGNKVKNSAVYKAMMASIKTDLSLSEDRNFPRLILKDIDVASKYGQKYTLIDFWFSYCKPCIDDMPKYKQIYERHKAKGFEYIGISTDRTQDISNWKKVIAKNGLVWQNLLDENGVIAKEYNINKFPTTFLVDPEGKILKKDITPEELEGFLQDNLK